MPGYIQLHMQGAQGSNGSNRQQATKQATPSSARTEHSRKGNAQTRAHSTSSSSPYNCCYCCCCCCSPGWHVQGLSVDQHRPRQCGPWGTRL